MLKRSLGLILLAFVTIASSVSCSRVETTSPSNVPANSQPSVATTSGSNVVAKDKPSVATTSPANIPAKPPSVGSSKTEVGSNSTIEPYLGTWIIKKYVPTGRVEGFSKKDANDYLGEKIIVDENQIVTSEGTIKAPEFIKKELNDTDFYNNWNLYFKNAGFTGSTVIEIRVSNFNLRNGTEDRIGSNFIVTNDNKAYTFIGGALFELGK